MSEVDYGGANVLRREPPPPVTLGSMILTEHNMKFIESRHDEGRKILAPNALAPFRNVYYAKELPAIPEHDLKVITKLYFKMYPDCFRKRGALLRYIKKMRENHEAPLTKASFMKRLKRKLKQQGHYIT